MHQTEILRDEPGVNGRSVQRDIYSNPVIRSGPDYPKVIAVFFHGGPFGEGRTTVAEYANDTGEIFNAAHDFTESAGRYFAGRIIAPGYRASSGVENGLGFILHHYRHGDQVVLYGYSYGVNVSVELSHSLNANNIPVSLLVTVDGSDGPGQNLTVNTSIPPNVDTNVNYYQTKGSGILGQLPGSSGGPNQSIQNVARVINRNVTADNTTHGNIQDQHQAEIENYFKEYINLYTSLHTY